MTANHACRASNWTKIALFFDPSPVTHDDIAHHTRALRLAVLRANAVTAAAAHVLKCGEGRSSSHDRTRESVAAGANGEEAPAASLAQTRGSAR